MSSSNSAVPVKSQLNEATNLCQMNVTTIIKGHNDLFSSPEC